MALFSRRRKNPDDASPAPAAESAKAAETSAGASAAEAPAAEVGISVSAFRGVGASAAPAAPTTPAAPAPAAQPLTEARRRGPAEAPPPSESVPGLRDNVLLRDALAELSAVPTAPELMNVARQLLQGHVFLRIKGDARALLSEGRPLPLAVVTREDKQYVLVYSSGPAMQSSIRADGDTDTTAMGQPVLTILRHVLDGPYEGIVLDNESSPARAVLPRPLLQRALDEGDPALRIKSLLAAVRTDATAGDVAAAVAADAPLWITVKRAEDGSPLGVAESRTPSGERFLEVFSHPLEALALGRGDQPLPVTPSQLAAALAGDPALTGVVVDVAGPWVRLTREQLDPVLPTPAV